MGKSTVSRRRNKPAKVEKPYPGFPLTPHRGTNRWCKQIRGKLHYFGPLDNPEGALKRFNREWPYLSEGRTPPPIDTREGCTIQKLANAFLNSKRRKLEAGELTERSFRDYYQTVDRIVAHFGRERRVDDIRPDDFEGFREKLARKLGTVSLKNEINRCRVVFKYAHDQRLIDKPVEYGQSFNRPSAKALRRARNEGGQRMFEAPEIQRVLGRARPDLRAMVLLAVNCGFGNTDVASLPLSAVDLESGWIDFPRPKTEIPRRIPLWVETVEAIRNVVAERPDAADPADSDLCFLTRNGRPYVRVQEKLPEADESEDDAAEAADAEADEKRKELVPVDTLSQRFSRLLHTLEINGRRGLGFYTLRHVFQTIGGESKDPDAVSSIMGHADASMAAVYRERISDERLRAVVQTVHDWLFPADESSDNAEAEGRAE